jgi:hypothetical protein
VAGVSPTPEPTYGAGIDACLLGTWRKTEGLRSLLIDGVQVGLSGGVGERMSFDKNGRFTVDYTSGTPYRRTYRGVRWEEDINGSASGEYQAVANVLTVSGPRANGQIIQRRNGAIDDRRPIELTPEPEHYTCAGAKLTSSGSYFRNVYARVS